MRNFCSVVLLLAIISNVHGQAPRFLRSPINTRSLNSINPAISGNGGSMIFMNDYTNDNTYQILYSYKDAQRRWIKPVELTIVKPYRSVMSGGYCIDFDGGSMMISITGGNNVGGFDLYESTFSNGKWSAKKNLGLPVNSHQHESYPAFSPDGSKLYFTRCVSFIDGVGSGCKIMVSERKRGRYIGWEEPVELSPIINMGNSSTPRILADGKTIYFMSGEGEEAKWYYSKYEENWSKPELMTFINAMEGRNSLAVYYRPDMLMTSIKNESGNFNLAEIKIPEQFQPAKAIIKFGVITNSSGDPIAAEIRGLDFETGEVIVSASTDPETGQYTIILPEGNLYDYSIFTRRGSEMYYSNLLDYEEIRNLKREKENHILKTIEDGTVLPLLALKFIEYSEKLDERSNLEIKRLSRLMKSNESFNIRIASYQDSVIVDSIARQELPMVLSDTLITYDVIVSADSSNASFPEMETFEMDSLLTVWNDSLAVVKNDSDTLLANLFIASLTGKVDSVEQISIHYTYHNDLTTVRAQTLAELLISNGVAANRIESVGFGDREFPKSDFSVELLKEGVIEVIFFKR